MTRNNSDSPTDRSVDEHPPNGAGESPPIDCPRQSSPSDESTDRDQRGDAPVSCRECPYDDGGSSRLTDFNAANRARMERRDVAKLLATVGGAAAVGSLAAPLAGLAKVFDTGPKGPVYEDGVPLVDKDGNKIAKDRLEYGSHMTVFPQTHPGISDAPTILIRFRESAYKDETRLPFTVAGYAAYSMVCTHAGCIVDGWENNIMVCPCHAGKYAPLEGAVVVGGPPPRPVPQLPITLSADGYLVAAGPFPHPVGPAEGE